MSMHPKMDPTVRVRIQNIPLSADDGQIKRALELRKCDIKSFFREKLRVDGRLTNCETGDRIAIIGIPETHLPIFMEIGKYRAKVYHRGQYNERIVTMDWKASWSEWLGPSLPTWDQGALQP